MPMRLEITVVISAYKPPPPTKKVYKPPPTTKSTYKAPPPPPKQVYKKPSYGPPPKKPVYKERVVFNFLFNLKRNQFKWRSLQYSKTNDQEMKLSILSVANY